ncbi:MAG TPA: ABC transporter substrate-binding protein [Thermoleophilaceae bacterium]|nr:ABC transporter substrate-binding protein [Thermoleophilaceae bacterium]
MSAHDEGQDFGSPITRRTLLRTAGATGAALAGGSLLAACGGSSGSSATTAAAAAGKITADGQKLNSILGLSAQDLALTKGKTLHLGAVLPLTGPGAEYGVYQGNGLKLAVEQIQQAGGPKINLTVLDHKSGDPQAGAAAARQLGIAGVGAVVASYIAVFGSMLPAVKRYQMLTLDGGGGTGDGYQGAPFFYGTRALTPDDPFVGTYKYVAQKQPDWKSVAFVVWDAGAAFYNPLKAKLESILASNGQKLVAFYPAKIGATDFSSIIAKLKAADPDVVQLSIWGPDPGYFTKQARAAGLRAQIIGCEYTPTAVKVAQSAYDNYWFGMDIFDFKNPPNPLSKFFVDVYTKKYGEPPTMFYSPNYFETTLAFWDLARRTAKAGGDINKGADLQQQLLANPTFASVYGGGDSTVGTFVLDKKTHSLATRPLGLFKAEGATIGFSPLATFDIGAKDFKVVA